VIVSLEVDGETRSTEVDGWESLLWLLRERFGLVGAKDACLQGECGSCSVIVDGELVCACLVMSADVDGARVTTVESLASEGHLHPVQRAFVEEGAIQCGYCTSGLVVATAHLLARHPDATEDDIDEGLAGNLCRCTGYGAIRRAVRAAQDASVGSTGGAR
jgi:aerobic carbon-monoxide dehydrogenase small subunit